MTTPAPPSPQIALNDLLLAAMEKLKAMTPEERDAMWQAQRESWVRGEMGMDESVVRQAAPADVGLAIGIADSACNEHLPNGGPLPLRDALAKRITAALADQRAAGMEEAAKLLNGLIDKSYSDHAHLSDANRIEPYAHRRSAWYDAAAAIRALKEQHNEQG